MSALTKYEAACRALAEAKSVDEVREISNQAEALRAYARQAKNRQLEVDAAEIRIRAERRMGEMLLAAKREGHFRQGAPWRGKSAIGRAKLREAGIDHKLASRGKRLASIPKDKFEPQLRDWRDSALGGTHRITTDLSIKPTISRRRGVVQGAPFKLPARDIRNMRVGELHRYAAFISSVLNRCGAANHSVRVGECVTDAVIKEAWR